MLVKDRRLKTMYFEILFLILAILLFIKALHYLGKGEEKQADIYQDCIRQLVQEEKGYYENTDGQTDITNE